MHAPWQQSVLNAVAVLIVTCPCALALAVPVVQVVASGRLMRQGILLKSATALERLAAIDRIVFDKTGTLTIGGLDLAEPRPAADDLRAAAALAGVSRHPLARALVAACPGVPVASGVEEHPGQGLSMAALGGEIRLGSRSFCGVAERSDASSPELWLARPGRAPVRFAFADRSRDDARATVDALKQAGLAVELLSGDRRPTVEAVAAETRIDTWQSDLPPAAKCARLDFLRARGFHVAMVGDGLNDAPALAAADVSLSPASAAEVSRTAADIVFQGARLAPVLEAWRTARASQALIRQNIGFALVYNACAVPLAILGHLTPLVAAAAMSSSSIVVVVNALRLARRKDARR
jgi:Cu2+-exporting ATPase